MPFFLSYLIATSATIKGLVTGVGLGLALVGGAGRLMKRGR